MKEYHVVGSQRVTGDFKLYVMFNDSNDWALWKALMISNIVILSDL